MTLANVMLAVLAIGGLYRMIVGPRSQLALMFWGLIIVGSLLLIGASLFPRVYVLFGAVGAVCYVVAVVMQWLTRVGVPNDPPH